MTEGHLEEIREFVAEHPTWPNSAANLALHYLAELLREHDQLVDDLVKEKDLSTDLAAQMKAWFELHQRATVREDEFVRVIKALIPTDRRSEEECEVVMVPIPVWRHIRKLAALYTPEEREENDG